MTPATEILYREHEVIMNGIDIAISACSLIGKNNTRYKEIVTGLLDFFRQYADKYHHHKEEILLFPKMEAEQQQLSDTIVHEMLENHADFREFTAKIEETVNAGKYGEGQQLLMQYTNALQNHIAAENFELFEIADNIIPSRDAEDLGFRYMDVDREIGEEKKRAYEDWIDEQRKAMLYS